MANPTINERQKQELVAAVADLARQNNWNARDLLTVMAFETAGSLDPWQAGPITQWGQHRGLIQWGEPQARQYGVSKNSTISQQVKAVGDYLKDRGVKSGAGIKEIYAAINGGNAKALNARDAKAGGTWGTVSDKVDYQMADEAKVAEGLLSQYSRPTPATMNFFGTGFSTVPGRPAIAPMPTIDDMPVASNYGVPTPTNRAIAELDRMAGIAADSLRQSPFEKMQGQQQAMMANPPPGTMQFGNLGNIAITAANGQVRAEPVDPLNPMDVLEAGRMNATAFFGGKLATPVAAKTASSQIDARVARSRAAAADIPSFAPQQTTNASVMPVTRGNLPDIPAGVPVQAGRTVAPVGPGPTLKGTEIAAGVPSRTLSDIAKSPSLAWDPTGINMQSVLSRPSLPTSGQFASNTIAAGTPQAAAMARGYGQLAAGLADKEWSGTTLSGRNYGLPPDYASMQAAKTDPVVSSQPIQARASAPAANRPAVVAAPSPTARDPKTGMTFAARDNLDAEIAKLANQSATAVPDKKSFGLPGGIKGMVTGASIGSAIAGLPGGLIGAVIGSGGLKGLQNGIGGLVGSMTGGNSQTGTGYTGGWQAAAGGNQRSTGPVGVGIGGESLMGVQNQYGATSMLGDGGSRTYGGPGGRSDGK